MSPGGRARERAAVALAAARERALSLDRAVVLAAGLILVGVLYRTYRFTAPIVDAHAFRQTQTASTVWLFDRFGWDPLHYRVPMFGGGHWVLEFPTYQTLVYGITLVTGYHEWAGRLVSIACFVAAAALLFLIARRWLGDRVGAALALVFFAFLPLSVFYFRAFMIDPLAIALTLGAIYAATRLFERFTWTWVSAYGVLLLLAVLTKPTIVLALGIPLATLGVRTFLARRTTIAERMALAAAWVLTGGLALAWNRHADEVNIRSNGMSFADERDWYFGTTFTDPTLWTTIADRILVQTTILGVAVIALGLAAIPSVATRHRPEIVGLAISMPLSIGVFANLNRVHDYYQLPYVVTLSLFGGMGLATVYRWVRRSIDARAAVQAVAALSLVLASLWALDVFKGYFGPTAYDLANRDKGRELAAHTPDEPLVVVESGADPSEPISLYEARRIGWRVPLEDPGRVQDLLREEPEVGAVAVLGGPAAVDPVLAAVLARAGTEQTFSNQALVVFERPEA
jgi:hypothetical protein